MHSMRKALAALVLALTVAMSLTGCLKVDAALTVSDRDTVNGKMVVAILKDVASQIPAKSKVKTDGLYVAGNGITLSGYDDGAFVGTTYTFENVPIKDFRMAKGNGSQLTIERSIDSLYTLGVLDFGEGSMNADDPYVANVLAQLSKTSQMKIEITYPGSVIETSGVISGTTVHWTPELGKYLWINADVRAPLTNWTLIYVLIGAAAILFATLIVFFVLRRKKASAAAMAKADEELNS